MQLRLRIGNLLRACIRSLLQDRLRIIVAEGANLVQYGSAQALELVRPRQRREIDRHQGRNGIAALCFPNLTGRRGRISVDRRRGDRLPERDGRGAWRSRCGIAGLSGGRARLDGVVERVERMRGIELGYEIHRDSDGFLTRRSSTTFGG